MDSALMKSNSNHNLKEQEERAAVTVKQQPEPTHDVQEHLKQENEQRDEQERLERKRSKRSKKESKSQKKHKKHKKSSRRLLEEDYAGLSKTELGHDGAGPIMGPESLLMDSEEAELARRRLRKQERKERKRHKKTKKQKRATQSERHLPTQSRAAAEEARLAKSLPEMEESPSTSPSDSTPQKTMSESQPAISSSKQPALESYLSNREGTGDVVNRPEDSYSRETLQKSQTENCRQSRMDTLPLHEPSRYGNERKITMTAVNWIRILAMTKRRLSVQCLHPSSLCNPTLLPRSKSPTLSAKRVHRLHKRKFRKLPQMNL